MKNIPFLIIIFLPLFMWSCQDEDAPRDTETNRYYADYNALYNSYDSLGNEATLALLDDYIKKFPERKESYIFKAYILGKLMRIEEADQFYELAKEKDSLNLLIYEQQAAFLLYDKQYHNKAKAVINNGLSISDSSLFSLNNYAWYYILNNNPDSAFYYTNQIQLIDSNHFVANRTAYVSALFAENDSIIEHYKTFDSEQADWEDIDSVLNESGVNGVYLFLLNEDE